MRSLFTLLFLGLCAFAQDKLEEKIQFNFATLVRSHQVYHGVLTFDGPTLFPGISLDFYQKVILRGPNIEYYKRYDKNRLSLGLRRFNDNGFGFTLPDDRRKNESRDHDRDATDIYAQAEFEHTYRIKTRFLLSTDLTDHYGQYLNSSITIPVLPFTRIGYGIGIGEKKHNRFLYGPSARSGTGHQDFLINIFIPFLPGKGILIANFNQVLTHFRQNRRAEFVDESDHPKVVTLIASWPLGSI